MTDKPEEKPEYNPLDQIKALTQSLDSVEKAVMDNKAKKYVFAHASIPVDGDEIELNAGEGGLVHVAFAQHDEHLEIGLNDSKEELTHVAIASHRGYSGHICSSSIKAQVKYRGNYLIQFTAENGSDITVPVRAGQKLPLPKLCPEGLVFILQSEVQGIEACRICYESDETKAVYKLKRKALKIQGMPEGE